MTTPVGASATTDAAEAQQRPVDPIPLLGRIAIALVAVAIVVVATASYIKKSVVVELRDHRARNEAENDCSGEQVIVDVLHAVVPLLLTDQPKRTPEEITGETQRVTTAAVTEYHDRYGPCTYMRSGRQSPLLSSIPSSTKEPPP